MIIISIINWKGGVGKTTTAQNIAGYLACTKGYNVLAIDLDPQANLSLSFGFRDVGRACIGAVLNDDLGLKDILKHSENCDVVIAPASAEHLRLARSISAQLSCETILKGHLLELHPTDYDFCIIDCPPTVDVFTMNALVASDYYIIPVQSEYFSVDGLTNLLVNVQKIKAKLNPALQCLGAFLTRNNRNERRKIHKAIKELLANQNSVHLFEADIRECVKLVECATEAKTIFQYAPNSNGAEDYRALVEEILKIIKTS